MSDSASEAIVTDIPISSAKSCADIAAVV